MPYIYRNLILFIAPMLTRYLFPYRFKRLGWGLAVLALVLYLLEEFQVLGLPHLLTWLPSPIGNADLPDLVAGRGVRNNHDLYAVLFIAGSMLAACSRERQEDEYIARLRLESLLWALYAYAGLLMLAFVLVSGTAFFQVMIYALFTPFLLFVARFQVVLFAGASAVTNEE